MLTRVLGHRLLPVLALALLLSLATPPGTAHAATITVNTTADELNSNGNCSLREAIHAANTNAAVDACSAGSGGTDIITLPAGTYALTVAGTGEESNVTGDLDILGDVSIKGAGAGISVIDGGGIDRVLDVVGSHVVGLDNLTITGGGTTAEQPGGGVYNRGALTLQNAQVTGNTASHNGGGIRSDGTLAIVDSTISDNHSQGSSGGGIFSQSGSITITRSTVSGNIAWNHGGGIYSATAAMTITTSTFSGNSTQQFDGGGIYRQSASLAIDNSTIAYNVAATSGGGVYGASGVRLVNTTIANNTAVSGPDCSGSPNSMGHNFIRDLGGCSFTPATGDIIGTLDAGLGPLQDNGGPTFTHALLPGSPAIDAGDNTACPSTDQRGAPRPAGLACDIGAYESGSLAPGVIPSLSRWALIGLAVLLGAAAYVRYPQKVCKRSGGVPSL